MSSSSGGRFTTLESVLLRRESMSMSMRPSSEVESAYHVRLHVRRECPSKGLPLVLVSLAAETSTASSSA